MTDISVIILVGKEERHIGRCLERLAPLEPRQVFVVESQKGDRTHAVAMATAECLNWGIEEKCLNVGIADGLNGAGIQTFTHSNIQTLLTLIWHDWPGLYAKQFNWALDNLPIESKWVLRLDADEYLTPDTIENFKQFLSQTPTLISSSAYEVTGLNLELKRRFCGGEIRHATVGIRQSRIFRFGIGRCEERAMDEHIVLSSGKIIDFDGAFYDDNLNDMDWWREKHYGYAKREAADAIAFARGEMHFKPTKEKYYRMPPYLRALVYFCIRYFLKGGFLDGYAGWMWNFWQGLWYRCLVDREIGRLRRAGV